MIYARTLSNSPSPRIKWSWNPGCDTGVLVDTRISLILRAAKVLNTRMTSGTSCRLTAPVRAGLKPAATPVGSSNSYQTPV